jgi:hypothetical protein
MSKAYVPTVIFLVVFIATKFVALRFGLALFSDVVAAVLGALATWRTSIAVPAKSGTSWPYAAAILVAFAFLAFVYQDGYVLPAHDPIALPTLAEAIHGGALPSEVYEPGTSAHSYPPGMPILIAPLSWVLSEIDRLFALKVIVLLAVAGIPAAWAWLYARLLSADARPQVLVPVAYVVFFGVERTLGFAIPFAGKVAILLGVAIAPAVMVAIVALARQPAYWIVGAVLTFGMTLAHYTLLHLLAAVLGAYSLVGLISGRIQWRDAIGIGAMGAGGAALMVLLMAGALHDPRAGGFSINWPGGIYAVIDTLLAKASPIVIFMDRDFGLPPSAYRGIVLLLAAVASFWIGDKLHRPDIREGAAVFSIALVTSLLFAFSVIPAGITLDFARWYAWPLQAGILIVAVMALWARFESSGVIRKAALVSAAAVAAYWSLSDARVYYKMNRASALPREALANMRNALAVSPNESCWVAAEYAALHVMELSVYKSRQLDYLEPATECRYLTGSWVHRGVPGGREIGGLPSAAALTKASAGGKVFAVLSPERLAAYAQALGNRIAWVSTGHRLGDAEVYLMQPARAVSR